jgi:hypothetical protein
MQEAVSPGQRNALTGTVADQGAQDIGATAYNFNLCPHRREYT